MFTGKSQLSQQPVKVTSDSRLRRSAVKVSLGGSILLILFVVMSRVSPTGPETENTAGAEAAEPAAETAAGPAAGPAAEPAADATSQPRNGPTRPDGCFRSGSSNAEVQAVMGAPDSVVFGEWRYGQSSVSFGYGVVLDYENRSGNLRLC